jgi:hypothetical protein
LNPFKGTILLHSQNSSSYFHSKIIKKFDAILYFRKK